MGYPQIRHRLHGGRPLVVDSDVGAALRDRGLSIDGPGALGAVLHKSPELIRAHHQAELASRVDVLSALTADTAPRALSEAGMEHRAARLTGLALELVSDVVQYGEKPVAIAGVLGSDQLTATSRGRFEDETEEHARRIAVGGAELLIVRGMGSRLDLVFGVAAAAGQDLPSWAVVDLHLVGDDELVELSESLADAGAEAILFEVASIDDGLRRLRMLEDLGRSVVLGTLLAAAPDALRGFPSPLYSSWVDRAVELTDAGARIVGGGAGTTEDHTRALAVRLGVLHPSMPPAGAPLAAP
ncbi:MAG TPA: homocysteine S-methyltransferase family protein [Polyangiaceae bacterium]|nr:homocysteine S-methyltransferase family protein [Polyangiaceae bacterium]